MENLTLAAETRSLIGKGPNRRLRAKGQLPGVLYGLGKTAAVAVNPAAVQAILMTEGGRSQVYRLTGSSELEGRPVLVKDYQIDPVSRRLVHVDLQEVDITKKVIVSVKLSFIGKSIGVADGGVLNIIERNIAIKAIPTNMPKTIEVDVTPLKIGASLHENDIKLPDGVELVSHRNSTIVTVVPPTREEEAQAVLTESAAGPEVITEKKPEEGAAASDGAAAKAGGDKAAAKPEDKAKK